MVRAVHEHNDRRSAGYGDIPYAVVRDGHAVDHPKRRVEAQRLLNDLSGKLELGNVARKLSGASPSTESNSCRTLSRQSGRELKR